MIELNHIFLFLALISPLAVLGSAWRPGGTPQGWRIAALIVLAVTGLAWWFVRPQAGYIGGVVWFLLLFLPAVGLRKTAELTALQRFRTARRLARAVYCLHPTKDLRGHIDFLRTLEQRQASGQLSPPTAGGVVTPRPWRLRHAPAVIGLLVLNAIVFGLEVRAGLPGRDVLYRMGALEMNAVRLNHEYWRLLTSLFLHANFLHLLFNLFALYILGPALERAIGSFRFLSCYLLAGLGSSLGVLLFSLAGWIRPAELVGASGCIMGIVGTWAGFLLRHRHIPEARRRLKNILLIVSVQVVFDIVTPQISMTAHLCGLVVGFIAGLMIESRPARTAAAAP